MNAQERTEYIDKFLLEEMSEQEKATFLNQMEADAAFRKEVAAQRLIIEALKMEEEQNSWMEEMEKFHANMEEEKLGKGQIKPLRGARNPFRSSSPYWLIAASILLLVSLGLFFFFSNSERSASPSYQQWAQFTLPAQPTDPALGFAGEGEAPNDNP